MRVLLRGSSLPFAEYVDEAERSAREFERDTKDGKVEDETTHENSEDEYLSYANGDTFAKKDAR